MRDYLAGDGSRTHKGFRRLTFREVMQLRLADTERKKDAWQRAAWVAWAPLVAAGNKKMPWEMAQFRWAFPRVEPTSAGLTAEEQIDAIAAHNARLEREARTRRRREKARNEQGIDKSDG